MHKGLVHSIESFGTVDGPGTRFVIFLQGCHMRCLYCHNPDTWDLKGMATEMSVEELLEQFNKVKEFITGGITVTGGEPLIQIDFLIDLFKEAKKQNIHTCVDTSAGTFKPDDQEYIDKVKELMSYTDLVLLDIKHIDSKQHKVLTGIPNERVLAFQELLDSIDQKVWIRHVLLRGYTLDDDELLKLGHYLSQFNNIEGIEVLPYHTMAIPKYDALKMDYPLEGVEATSHEEAKRAKQIILLAMKEAKKD
ncbi:MAG: pyruvate formate-lyase-activating protein [Mycoplasmatales bacterium]